MALTSVRAEGGTGGSTGNHTTMVCMYMTDKEDRARKSGSWDVEVVTGASLVVGAGEA